MFKMIGALCVFGAASLLGFARRHKMVVRVQMLNRLIAGFSMLRTQIVFLQTPLAAAMEEIAKETECAVFARFAEQLACGQSPQSAMQAAVLGMERADAKVLTAAASGLGCSDCTTQAQHLDALCKRLGAQLSLAETALSTYGRLCASAGMLFGLLLVILLL